MALSFEKSVELAQALAEQEACRQGLANMMATMLESVEPPVQVRQSAIVLAGCYVQATLAVRAIVEDGA